MSSNKKSVTINKIIRVRMAMVYLIWRAMFGNGVRIGMTATKKNGCCAGWLGQQYWRPACGQPLRRLSGC